MQKPKTYLAEKLKCAKNQEDWPARHMIIANEDSLLQIACDYQMNGVSFEESFAFKTNLNASMPALTRHNNAENVHCEYIRVSCDDVPCHNCCEKESTDMLGSAPI